MSLQKVVKEDDYTNGFPYIFKSVPVNSVIFSNIVFNEKFSKKIKPANEQGRKGSSENLLYLYFESAQKGFYKLSFILNFPAMMVHL